MKDKTRETAIKVLQERYKTCTALRDAAENHVAALDKAHAEARANLAEAQRGQEDAATALLDLGAQPEPLKGCHYQGDMARAEFRIMEAMGEAR